MAVRAKVLLGIFFFLVAEPPSWTNPQVGNWTVSGQRVAGNCNPVLLPFGPAAGDSTYNTPFDVAGNVNPTMGPFALPSTINLLGSGPYGPDFYIHAQGVITFDDTYPNLVTSLPASPATTVPMIMVNPREYLSSSMTDGNIFYRVVTNADPDAMQPVQDATMSAWGVEEPNLLWALVVTWSCVKQSGAGDSERNTFQFVLTTDGTQVATYHNFADVLPGDMIVGLQAGGQYGGNLLTHSFFADQFNACPCGRWALLVHNTFSAPATGVSTCPGSCPDLPLEGCVDCLALCYAPDIAQDPSTPGECACTLTDSHVLELVPYAITFSGGFVLSSVTLPDGSKRQDINLVTTDSGDDYVCKLDVAVTVKRTTKELQGKVDNVKIGFGDVDKAGAYKRNVKYIRKTHRVTVTGPEQVDFTDDVYLDTDFYEYSDAELNVTLVGTPLNGFKAYSPQCNWVIEYMPSVEVDLVQVAMDRQPVTGLCGDLSP